MNIQGTATGKAADADTVWALMWLLMIALIIAGVIGGMWQIHQERLDCHNLGGWYVETRGTDMCVRDGQIIKIY